MPRPFLMFLVCSVAVGWAVNLAFTLIAHHGDPAINGLFALILGGLFAHKSKGSRSSK